MGSQSSMGSSLDLTQFILCYVKTPLLKQVSESKHPRSCGPGFSRARNAQALPTVHVQGSSLVYETNKTGRSPMYPVKFSLQESPRSHSASLPQTRWTASCRPAHWPGFCCRSTNFWSLEVLLLTRNSSSGTEFTQAVVDDNGSYPGWTTT